MTLKTDSKGQLYADVDNVRITYVPAERPNPEAVWTRHDAIRIQAYREGTTGALHSGAELPIPSSEVFAQFVAAICQVYTDGRERAQT